MYFIALPLLYKCTFGKNIVKTFSLFEILILKAEIQEKMASRKKTFRLCRVYHKNELMRHFYKRIKIIEIIRHSRKQRNVRIRDSRKLNCL